VFSGKILTRWSSQGKCNVFALRYEAIFNFISKEFGALELFLDSALSRRPMNVEAPVRSQAIPHGRFF
jgi:hypothetical protein